jgi:hypothetical protein
MLTKISSRPELLSARIAPAWRLLVEPDAPPTQTKPQRQDSTGWFTRIKRRIKLAMEGDDEELLVANTTAVSWHIYHKYHLLGIVDPWETHTFRLRKSGNLNARPGLASDESEYLVVDLNSRIQRVEIYRRQMGLTVDVYDMRAA